MKKIRWYVLAGAFTFIAVAILVFGSGVLSGINVRVLNISNEALKDVLVSYTGGSNRLGELSAGANKSVKIKPTGESHLELTIYSRSGAVQHRLVEVYFEPGNRGSIEITIAQDFAVTAVTDIKNY